jgi:hypothetical protein
VISATRSIGEPGSRGNNIAASESRCLDYSASYRSWPHKAEGAFAVAGRPPGASGPDPESVHKLNNVIQGSVKKK